MGIELEIVGEDIRQVEEGCHSPGRSKIHSDDMFGNRKWSEEKGGYGGPGAEYMLFAGGPEHT